MCWPRVGAHSGCRSVAQLCPTPCNPVDCSAPAWGLLNAQPPAKTVSAHMTQLPSNMYVPWSVASLQGLPGLTVSVVGNPGGSSYSIRDSGISEARNPLGSWTCDLCLSQSCVSSPTLLVSSWPLHLLLWSVHVVLASRGLLMSRSAQAGAQGLQGKVQWDYGSRRGYNPPAL